LGETSIGVTDLSADFATNQWYNLNDFEERAPLLKGIDLADEFKSKGWTAKHPVILV